MINIHPYVKKTYLVLVHLFAIIGFLLVGGYLAVRFHLTDTLGIIDEQQRFFLNGDTGSNAQSSAAFENNVANQEQWITFKDAVLKDKAVLEQVSSLTGVDSRVIVSVLATEQLRFFFTDRASFKKFFEPLKILGNETQFSWGVMGIKETTAVQIENNLRNPNSSYYLGKKYEHLLDFPAGAVSDGQLGVVDGTGGTTTVSSTTSGDPNAQSIEQIRFARITDPRNRYYAYLYGALFIKQIETQWKNAGFDISDRPEILATLFDLGFQKSKPNANPKVGGAEIDINGNKWSFGGLAYDVYHSDELPEFSK